MIQVERKEVIEILRDSHIFQLMDDEEIENLADLAEAFYFEPDQLVYEQGEEANGLYFLLEGRVELVRDTIHGTKQMMLEPKDYFGEEAFPLHPVRRKFSAYAVTQSLTIFFSATNIQVVLDSFPELRNDFDALLKSLDIAATVDFHWRPPKEAIHFACRRNLSYLVLRSTPAILISAGLLAGSIYLANKLVHNTFILNMLILLSGIVFLIWLIWFLTEWFNDFAVVTNKRVIKLEKTIALYEARAEAPIEAIIAKDVRSTQLGRLLGYSDLIVRTYTGEIVLNGLSEPDLTSAVITELQGRHVHTSAPSGKELIEQAIRERIDPSGKPLATVQDEDIESDEDDIVYDVEPGGVQTFLSALFSLREEEGDTLIYRTHWIELLKKIGVPLLILLLSAAVVVLAAIDILPMDVGQALTAMAALGAIGLLYMIYQWMDWRNDRYLITEDMLVDLNKKPFGTEDRRSAPIKNVLSIDYKRKGLSGILFNYGTVVIHVGDTDLTFDSVLDPAGVQQEIFDRVAEFKERAEKEEARSRREELADWIEQYHAVTNPSFKPKSTDTQPLRVHRLDDTQPLR